METRATTISTHTQLEPVQIWVGVDEYTGHITIERPVHFKEDMTPAEAMELSRLLAEVAEVAIEQNTVSGNS